MSAAWEMRVRGLVQGVGFRPTVWRLAHDAGLAGEVLNDAEGVVIRLACDRVALARFEADLRRKAPPLARIETIESTPFNGPLTPDFHIAPSRAGKVNTGITPDAATCCACLADISDPKNRRFNYPFTNCTHCGPRLTITNAIPYDRARTSMAHFPMCPDCRDEYEDPADRRYHAQPNACSSCGPRLWLVDAHGQTVRADPLDAAARAIVGGGIVAIKGLGGFQLAVDAGNEAALARLRERKHRPAKPLALMVTDLDMAAQLVVLDAQARALLQSWQAPIVLLPRRDDLAPSLATCVAPSVAPGQNRLGVMLPNSPLHHILMRVLARPVVLTSGNPVGEPQVTANEEALQKLAHIADFWLLHDRDIVNRMDDSVIQFVANAPQVLRRARGLAPAPLTLHEGFGDAPPVLAMGADLKNTFCLMKNRQAIVSQHMGDMENPQTQRDFRANLDLYRRIYDFTPAEIAIDAHPGYFTARLGHEYAAEAGLTLKPVQHHHAHVAASMAEHGFAPDAGPVLGIVLDGLGYGGDGSLWGGEFLLADFSSFRRLAHFSPVALPGGEKANRQPWRNLLAHLYAIHGRNVLESIESRYGALPAVNALRQKPVSMLVQMIEKPLNSPVASSAGRLFDAVAAALGLCFERVDFEGQAAMQLQALAGTCPHEHGFYLVEPGDVLVWDALWDGILTDIQAGVSLEIIAKRFHNSIARVVVHTGLILAARHQTETVVLTGGVFQNSLLLGEISQKMKDRDLRVLSPVSFPVNDGGISLGQATVITRKRQYGSGARAFSSRG